MDVRHALLMALAAAPLTGCPAPGSTAGDCNPPARSFELDDAVSTAELDQIVANYSLNSWADLNCAMVCRETYQLREDWKTSSIDGCELTLPEHPDGSGEPGRVSCTGIAIQYYCLGRRPFGHVEHDDHDCTDSLGRTLAISAHLEAASVSAFEQLAAQLSDWGAPSELIERCFAAANDERAHTRWLTALAAHHGASVPPPTQTAASQQLVDVAMHNAVEGCVHETFAALLAACWATRATSPALRRVFAKIAADETRHGQLAWDLHAWLQSQLEPEQAAAVADAQTQALAVLPERARELAASLPVELGSSTDAEALARALTGQLAA